MNKLVEQIRARRDALPANRCLIVAISGIDASGKGFVSAQLARQLESHGLRTYLIPGDGWLNLPGKRFSTDNPGEHFYHHAFRFEELFAKLIEPLRATRSVHLVAEHTEETATEYGEKRYDADNVDVAIVEAVFLFREEFREQFDFTIWINCTFETAQERAIVRAQEGLPPAETIRAFETIYFPAQRYHFERDRPRERADAIWVNDPRIATASGGRSRPTAGHG